MKKRIGLFILIALVGLNFPFALSASTPIRSVTVGSKSFTEGYVLAEMIAHAIEQAGEVQVIRKFGMGGTGILSEAIKKGAVDLYPEYSGTITEEILKTPEIKSLDLIRRHLEKEGLTITGSLGFSNTYALAMRADLAQEDRISSVEDLRNHRELKFGFSHEFLNRLDGYPKLAKIYGLHPSQLNSMEHSLSYEALVEKKIDVMDVYSTDGKIGKLHLLILKDNRNSFPDYEAVILARKDFKTRFPKSWKAVSDLEGTLSEAKMIELNDEMETQPDKLRNRRSLIRSIWLRTEQHLTLVLVSLLFSILVGVPLGILSARNKGLGQGIFALSSVFQTIPSLALLVFLIPFFGIGTEPAWVALFLYALLPIVMSTANGIKSIDGTLIESARALELTKMQKLRWIELPLASPFILTGVRTSAIIAIGTATLAALIGAGGYGVPIVTGLTLNDIPTILEGAIPAAVLALVAQGVFELLEIWIIPRGLRGKASIN